jgi:tetratricopeptide (TPR) repeat protein
MSEISIGSKPPPIRAVSRQSDRATVYFWEGIRQQTLFNHERAIYLFDRALRRDAQFLVAAYQQSWSYIAQGKYPEAIYALRACIIKYEGLQKSLKALESVSGMETIPRKESLCVLYESLVLFNALLVKTVNKSLGDLLLIEYLLNDQTLPKERKKNEMRVKGLLGKQSLVLKIGEGTRRVGPRERYEECLKSLFINLASNVLYYFAVKEDYAATKALFLAHLKIIASHKGQGSPQLAEMRKGLQINLAKILLEIRETTECRRILEELFKEDPNDKDVQRLLDKLNGLN